MAELAAQRGYRFGRFRLDPTERVLFLDDRAIPLPPKAADTLLLLVQNAGHVVEKRDLLKEIWRGTFVEEGTSFFAPFTRRMPAARSGLRIPVSAAS